MKHYIIYLPGLGDKYDRGRAAILKLWPLLGIRIQMVPMRWYDGEDFDKKLTRVFKAIDTAEAKGYIVSLVGESAGGSMALNAAARRSHLHRIVTISGVDSPHMKLASVTLQKSPAFGLSIQKLEGSLRQLDLTRIHTIRGVADHTVAARHSIIVGAHNHKVFVIGHLPTIAACLTIFSRYIVSLIRRAD